MVKLIGQQRLNQKKTATPTREQPTKTSVKSQVHPVEELQAAIGNREMGRLIETNRLPLPSSPVPKLQGELPLLGGMPVSQGTIQRQPLFRGLSQELTADTAMALLATGAVIQPKLTLGTPGDMYEEEADSVARQVVEEIHSSPFREPNTQSLGERKPDGGEALRVQRQITVRAAGDAGGELSSEWETQLQRAKSGGQPLSPTLKEPMEQAFGANFGGVRVHTGEQADGLARSIQAKAFTTGQDVFFRQGAYEPGSRRWEELLAHELTHVVQQSGAQRKAEQKEDGIHSPTNTNPHQGIHMLEAKKVMRAKGALTIGIEKERNDGYVIGAVRLYNHPMEEEQYKKEAMEGVEDAQKILKNYKEAKTNLKESQPNYLKKNIFGGDLKVSSRAKKELNPEKLHQLKERVKYINGMREKLKRLLEARNERKRYIENPYALKTVYTEKIKEENEIIEMMKEIYNRYLWEVLKGKNDEEEAKRKFNREKFKRQSQETRGLPRNVEFIFLDIINPENV